jgi:hypothetical protein
LQSLLFGFCCFCATFTGCCYGGFFSRFLCCKKSCCLFRFLFSLGALFSLIVCRLDILFSNLFFVDSL